MVHGIIAPNYRRFAYFCTETLGMSPRNRDVVYINPASLDWVTRLRGVEKFEMHWLVSPSECSDEFLAHIQYLDALGRIEK